MYYFMNLFVFINNISLKSVLIKLGNIRNEEGGDSNLLEVKGNAW